MDRDVARTGRVRSGRRGPSSFIINHQSSCVHALVGRPRARSVYRSTARPRRGRGARDEAVSFFSYRRLRRVPGVGVVRVGTGTGTGVVGVVRVTVRFGI